jgi:hypothetical protein
VMLNYAQSDPGWMESEQGSGLASASLCWARK